MNRGLTLVEVLIVMVVIGILVAIIIPNYKNSVIKAKEAVLKENLFMLRDAINKFYFDKKKYPTSLEELVGFRYLREIPIDPILGHPDWESVYLEPGEAEDYDPEMLEGIVDVKSKASGTAQDGTRYADW